MLDLDYQELYQLSLSQPEKVWDVLAKEVVWSKPYHTVLDDKQYPVPNWFVGREINMSYNCLDHAIEEGYGDKIAVIHESPVTETTKEITYKELLESVELLAGVMVDKCGITKGDRVIMYFPVIPEGLIAMLACTRIGAIYTVVFGGYSSKEITKRIEHLEAKLILTCNIAFEPDCTINYKETVDKAIEQSKFTPSHCIVYNRPNSEPAIMIEGRDLDWMSEMKGARPQSAIPMESSHPMFIIYTSGTTGEPKGLVMATGSSVVTDKNSSKYFFDIKEKETMWMFSDYGWITGQTVMTYVPLLNRYRTILYEGKPVTTPDPGQIVRIMNRHKVVSFISSSTVLRILRKYCCEEDLKLTYNGLKVIYVGGEVSDLDLRNWISTTFKCHVFDVYGQSELRVPILSPCLGFKGSSVSKSRLSLGFQVVIIDSKTKEEVPSESVGEILLKIQKCPGIAITMYKNHEKYIEKYFSKYPGYYDTHDSGKLMEDGTVVVLSRTDDIIHVSSIRICGGAVEECGLRNQNLINAAVVPMDDSLNGQVPFGFLVKRNAVTDSDEKIINDTIELVKQYFGEFAMFKNAVIVPDLPKTRSDKIIRYSLASMINLKSFEVPPAIANPEVYREIYDILVNSGYKATMPLDS